MSTHEKPHLVSQRPNQPMVCAACGSTHFIKALAEEFSAGGYSSVEFRPLTAGFQPPSAYVCLCGTPMPVNGVSLGEVRYDNTPKGRFLTSLQKAIAFRKAQQPQVLAQGFVSLAEHEELRDQVAMQQDQIERLLDAVEASEGADVGDTNEGL